MGVSLHLRTNDYCENDGGEFLDEGDGSDWGSKLVWNNYHSFGVDGVLLSGTPEKPISLAEIALTTYSIDPLPQAYQRFLDDDLTFEIYLLGHDSVADHQIEIGEYDGSAFGIEWTARIALSYAGEETFDRCFATRAALTDLAEIHVAGDEDDRSALSALRAVLGESEEFQLQRNRDVRSFVRIR